MNKNVDYTNIAKEVFTIEAQAVADLCEQLDDDFNQAVSSILASNGRVVICGMGKSGLIGKKICATLASTGTPSFFMHPGEAYHGDLGMVTANDVFLALSNSGETEELIRLVPFLKDNGNTLISMTGRKESTLASNSNYHLDISVKKEACPLQLAPTASTTATLAMGDALAVALMQARDFQPENFARFHPGGSLGRRLLTRVEHVMRRDALPTITANTPIPEVIHAISEGRLGMAIVTEGQKVLGVITDGDLRRAMEADATHLLQQSASELMTSNPRSIEPGALIAEAADLMNELNITSLLVVEQGELKGAVQLFDCNV